MSLHVKKGDAVVMRQGKDRGKKGKVLNVVPPEVSGRTKVIVEGLNKIKRHQRAKKQGQKGQIVERERAVDASSVQLICPKCNKPARTGYKKEGKNKKRICKKCEAEF